MNARWIEHGMGLGRVYIGDQPITDTIGKTDGRSVASAFNAVLEGDESRRPKAAAFVKPEFMPKENK